MFDLEQESNEVDETTAQDSSTEETNDETSMSGEDASGESSVQTTDEESEEGSEKDEYAEELERLRSESTEYRQKLEKAENKIVKLKKGGKESAFDPEEFQENLLKKFDERITEREIKSREREYDKYITSISSTKGEAELTKHHLKYSIKPTGDMEADVRRAKILANESKIVKTNKELANTLRVRSTMGTAPNFSGTKLSNSTPANLSTKEKSLLSWAEKVSGKKIKNYG